MEICAEANQNLINIEKEDNFELAKFFKKIPNYIQMVFGLIKLYCLPPIETKYSWTEQV